MNRDAKVRAGGERTPVAGREPDPGTPAADGHGTADDVVRKQSGTRADAVRSCATPSPSEFVRPVRICRGGSVIFHRVRCHIELERQHREWLRHVRKAEMKRAKQDDGETDDDELSEPMTRAYR